MARESVGRSSGELETRSQEDVGAPAGSGAGRGPPAARRSVLVVGEEPEVRSALSRELAGRYQVSIAPGLEEALDLLAEHEHLDAIVTDLHGREEADGYALLELVRLRVPRCIRVLLSSRLQGDWFVRNGVAHRFVEKPCEPEAVLELMKELLE